MHDHKVKHNHHLAKVVEKQMRNWEIAHAQTPPPQDIEAQQVAHFVTIANIVGAGGREVANLLAEKLDWPVFDRSLVTRMAGDDEVQARLYKSMDERDLGWLEATCRALMQKEFRKNDYFQRLCQTILSLARKGPAIFIGRAADLILPKNRGLRVKVIAARQRCAENFARNNQVSVEEALAQVERIEQERRTFVQHHFHIDSYEPTRFDMLINVERFTAAQAVELIRKALILRGIIE